MKKLAIVLLFTPLLAFAGGHHEKVYTPPPPQPVSETPKPVVPPQPTPPAKQDSVSSSPVVVKPSNGQIYCSSPTAPGWRVDLPNGGCKPIVSVKAPTTTKPVSYLKLSKMPYTGGEGLTYGQIATIAFFVAAAGAYIISRTLIK